MKLQKAPSILEMEEAFGLERPLATVAVIVAAMVLRAGCLRSWGFCSPGLGLRTCLLRSRSRLRPALLRSWPCLLNRSLLLRRSCLLCGPCLLRGSP